jgi:hypothetical protein
VAPESLARRWSDGTSVQLGDMAAPARKRSQWWASNSSARLGHWTSATIRGCGGLPPLGGSGGRRPLGTKDDGGGGPPMLRQWRSAQGRRCYPARRWSSSLTSTTAVAQDVEGGDGGLGMASRGKWRQQCFDLRWLREEKGKKENENGSFQESSYIRQFGPYRQPCAPYIHG